jgi:hypothetical protein
VTRQPELSVVIPLTDARGEAVDHLRTWTHNQTLARWRYQVVLVSDGVDPAGDRAVAALLESHDVLETAPGAGLIELYNTAARLAAAPWLLFTENHCEAEADCLEQALEGIETNPNLEAASIEHGHLTPAVVGELGARWFDEVYEEWFSPGAWRRLNLAGFVIRGDSFQQAGGLEARYSLFATPLLAARLEERGAVVGHLPRARILHVHVDGIDEHHGHSADYAEGESDARTSLPAAFAERYFGFRPLVWNRRATEPRSARRYGLLLAREIPRSVRRGRADAGWLLRSLAAKLPEAIAGVRLRRRLADLAFRWSERIADSRWVPRGRRYRAYLRAQDRVVRLAQLRWIEERTDAPASALGPGIHPVESVGEGTIVGVHGLELHNGRWFRWSEPVLTVRAESPGPAELRVDTGGLRGSPLGCVAAVYLGTRRLRAGQLRDQGPELVIQLPGGSAELTLLCRPLPTSAGEKRGLGLPIFSVELSEPFRPPQPVGAPEPAAVA